MNFDLTISTKTVALQPVPGKPYNEPTTSVNVQKLKVVTNSPTLEALSRDQCILMMRFLPELQKPVWHLEYSVQMSGSKMESSLAPIKLKVYKAVVLSTLMYACETLTVYQCHLETTKNQVARQDSRQRS